MDKRSGKQSSAPDDPADDGMPANIEAEKFVLGSVLLDAAKHLPVARTELKPEDFDLQKHQTIFRRVLDLDGRGEKVDRVTVADELERHKELTLCDGASYLVTLDDHLPNIPNIESYIRIVHDKAERRRVIVQFDRLRRRAFNEAEPLGALFAEAAAYGASLNGAGRATEPPPSVPVWPVMSEDAYHGVAGDLVRAIEPHTEADPAALLVQFLVGFGSLAGRGPYYLAESDRHHTNEFAVIVGTTSKGRKGTSWGRILDVLRVVDDYWTGNRQLAGLGSGEALIDAADEEDRRMLVTESEFARLLAVSNREGSTISANLRRAWETGTLELRTRQNKVKITGAHVSLLGHITREELLRRLDSTEMMNGLGNRILWCCARRSKMLPFGGGSIAFGDIPERLRRATDFARKLGDTRIGFDAQARTLWARVYPELSEGKSGMFGAVTSRAEAHSVRLALIYALLDRSEEIGVEHLRGALGTWRYAEASARFIWGDALGDPEADEILKALRAVGDAGMTRWEIINHFSRHKKAETLERALALLGERGLIRSATEQTGGRPVTRFWSL